MGVEYVERAHMQRMPRSDELVERLVGAVPDTTLDNVMDIIQGRIGGAWAQQQRSIMVDLSQIIGERPMSSHTPPSARLPTPSPKRRPRARSNWLASEQP